MRAVNYPSFEMYYLIRLWRIYMFICTTRVNIGEQNKFIVNLNVLLWG